MTGFYLHQVGLIVIDGAVDFVIAGRVLFVRVVNSCFADMQFGLLLIR